MEEKLSDISLDTVMSGRRIHSLFIKNGYTVKEIQKILGLGCPQSVYNWLYGKTLPSVDNLYRMSRLFHVHMEDMLAEAQK